MAEKVVVHQNKKLETMFMVWDPQSPQGTILKTVEGLQEFTPSGLLLASLGADTAMVLLTFAHKNKITLDEVEITLEYDRTVQKDCEDCDEITDYREMVRQNIVLHGSVSETDRERLGEAALHSAIYKLLNHGMQIASQTNTIGQMREEELRKD